MNRREFLKASTGSALAAAWAGCATRPTAPRAPGPRKSIMLSMLPPKLPLDEKFARARRAGFEGIEITTPREASGPSALRAAADRAGLAIHSVGCRNWGELTDPDPRVRGTGQDELRRSLRCARAVGADVVLLVPGVVDGKTRYAEAYERSQAEIRRALPLARELGVVIAIEEVWNDFLLSPLEFARYIDEFNSPFVRAYFDVGNVVKNGWPQDWIRTLGRRIVRVHLKDFRKMDHKFVPLLEGDVDWREVRRAFRETGFTGYMTAEFNGDDVLDPDELSRRMGKILAGK